MKKTISLLTLAVLCLTNLKAQTTFRCSGYTTCYRKSVYEKYDNCKTINESSLIVFYENENKLSYSVENGKPYFYYVTLKEYDREEGVLYYGFVSEKGVICFAPKRKVIVIVLEIDGREYSTVFTVEEIY